MGPGVPSGPLLDEEALRWIGTSDAESHGNHEIVTLSAYDCSQGVTTKDFFKSSPCAGSRSPHRNWPSYAHL